MQNRLSKISNTTDSPLSSGQVFSILTIVPSNLLVSIQKVSVSFNLIVSKKVTMGSGKTVTVIKTVPHCPSALQIIIQASSTPV